MSGKFLTREQLRLQLPAHLAFVGPGQERASLALPASLQKAALDRWHAPELGLHVAHPTAQPHGIGANQFASCLPASMSAAGIVGSVVS
jgi:hypothetical protein